MERRPLPVDPEPEVEPNQTERTAGRTGPCTGSEPGLSAPLETASLDATAPAADGTREDRLDRLLVASFSASCFPVSEPIHQQARPASKFGMIRRHADSVGSRRIHMKSNGNFIMMTSLGEAQAVEHRNNRIVGGVKEKGRRGLSVYLQIV